jgi:hypothetical protein
MHKFVYDFGASEWLCTVCTFEGQPVASDFCESFGVTP